MAEPVYPTLPSLVGDEIYLRIVTPDDIAQTHHWLIQSDPHLQTCEPFVMMTASEAAEIYRKKERTVETVSYITIRKKDNTPIARIRYFNYNPMNRSAEIGYLVDPDQRRKGYARESILVLCRYLFRNLGLHKVHAQTASVNIPSVQLLESCGFKRDGVLRAHHFYNGEFHDDFIYSILAFELGR
ncbi:MAG: GNAT family protein [candidate division Zixibacteria bacterium]|nr:GNAT family protein [candidate division Zixibacteria bacterium]